MKIVSGYGNITLDTGQILLYLYGRNVLMYAGQFLADSVPQSSPAHPFHFGKSLKGHESFSKF